MYKQVQLARQTNVKPNKLELSTLIRANSLGPSTWGSSVHTGSYIDKYTGGQSDVSADSSLLIAMKLFKHKLLCIQVHLIKLNESNLRGSVV